MRPIVEQTWGWDEQWQRADFRRRLASCDVSIVEVDSQCVGGLMLETGTAGTIQIRELQILPDKQGQGFGTCVIGTLIQRASGQNSALILWVARNNERARRLYERLGFTVVGQDGPLTQMRYGVGL